MNQGVRWLTTILGGLIPAVVMATSCISTVVTDIRVAAADTQLNTESQVALDDYFAQLKGHELEVIVITSFDPTAHTEAPDQRAILVKRHLVTRGIPEQRVSAFSSPKEAAFPDRQLVTVEAVGCAKRK